MNLSTTTRRRFSDAEQLFQDHQERLSAYINNRLPSSSWRDTEAVVRETWLEALTFGELTDDTKDGETGLPAWLTAAARSVVRRRCHPVPAGDTEWNLLTQILGHTNTWPEHWHRILVEDGQAALLRRAASDMTPARPTVVSLPSAMPARHQAAAAA